MTGNASAPASGPGADRDVPAWEAEIRADLEASVDDLVDRLAELEERRHEEAADRLRRELRVMNDLREDVARLNDRLDQIEEAVL